MTNLFALKTAAQSHVDKIAPNKVKFTLEKNEQGRNELVMRYCHYRIDGELVWFTKTCRPDALEADLLINYIEKRADFLNANYYWQMKSQVANVHPQLFKQWRNEFKRTSSDVISYLDKDPELVK
tara:strand:+ start:62 stop:436 length:375 start_codon:yes stop_codon:yes gene_type:complete